jgi:hypothetical protein
MIPLAGSGTEPSTLELEGFAGRVCHLITRNGHHYHQHFFVYVNSCYRVRHNVLSGEEAAERAIDNDYAPLRAHGPSSTDGSCHMY